METDRPTRERRGRASRSIILRTRRRSNHRRSITFIEWHGRLAAPLGNTRGRRECACCSLAPRNNRRGIAFIANRGCVHIIDTSGESRWFAETRSEVLGERYASKRGEEGLIEPAGVRPRYGMLRNTQRRRGASVQRTINQCVFEGA